jgi:predicted GIY-YIG superfamily endonuclease
LGNLTNAKTEVLIKKQAKKLRKRKISRIKPVWYVYAIECANASVYIGQTRDLTQRWEQHCKGQGAQWTRKHKPLRLFYSEECKSYLAARRREIELKKSKGRNLLKSILKTINQKTTRSVKKVHSGGNLMAESKSDLLTAGNIAKALSVPDTRVKKALQELGIKPAAKKGVCNYYSRDTVARVKAALK